MVPFEAVARLGIDLSKPLRKIDITTGSGIVLSPVVRIPRFRALGQEMRNLEVACHDLPAEGIVNGLLGLNFLKNFNVHLNFLTRQLEVTSK